MIEIVPYFHEATWYPGTQHKFGGSCVFKQNWSVVSRKSKSGKEQVLSIDVEKGYSVV